MGHAKKITGQYDYVWDTLQNHDRLDKADIVDALTEAQSLIDELVTFRATVLSAVDQNAPTHDLLSQAAETRALRAKIEKADKRLAKATKWSIGKHYDVHKQARFSADENLRDAERWLRCGHMDVARKRIEAAKADLINAECLQEDYDSYEEVAE